jgi:hypothetical protein
MSHRFKQPFYESFAAEVIRMLKRERRTEEKQPDSVYSSGAVQKGDDAAGHGKAFTGFGR